MALKEDIQNAIKASREGKERKFDQTVDLLLNLQKFQVKKESLNLVVNAPHKIKDKKVCAFLEVDNENVDTITIEQFKKYTKKAQVKKLIGKYDFFIAEGKLMPKVATTFGRALGPTGKMPSPQLGIMMKVDDKAVSDLLDRINKSIKIRTREASIKVAIGKQSMSDEDLTENAMAVYNTVEKALTRGRENIKNVEVKFTMTKPIKIALR